MAITQTQSPQQSQQTLPDEPISTEREVLAECDDFLVELSWSIDPQTGFRLPFMHLLMERKPSVVKELKELMPRLARDLYHIVDGQMPHPYFVLASATDDTDAIARLAHHFGYKYLMDAECTDGKRRKLYIYYLE